MNFCLRRSQPLIASVSSRHGCDESHQTPIRIKPTAMWLPTALAALPPQKNVGTATRPRVISQFRGCRLSGANPRLAHVAGDPLSLQIGDGSLASHSLFWWLYSSPRAELARRRRNSRKTTIHVKWLALLQHVIAGARQLVRQRLGRHRRVRLCLLSLIEALCLRTESQCEMRRFHKRPG